MKATHLLASLAVSFAAVSAHAQTPTPAAPAPADFATHKTRILSHIDQRIAAMTAMRDCVNAANSKADLKSCHKQGERHSHHAPA